MAGIELETQRKKLEGLYTKIKGNLRKVSMVSKTQLELILAHKDNELRSQLFLDTMGISLEVLEKAEKSIESKINDYFGTLNQMATMNGSGSGKVSLYHMVFKGMEHDIKTPLTPIKSASELLLLFLEDYQEGKISLEIGERLCRSMLKGAENMEKITDDYHHITKSGEEKPHIELNPLPLKKYFNELICTYKTNKSTMKLTYECDSDITVETDIHYVNIVANNLIKNAIRYTLRDAGTGEKHVKIGAKKENGAVMIYVQDNGIGIPENEIEKIFEPGYRAANAAGITGDGMGLAICKHLLGVIGSNITAENNKDGKGSTFYFTLPSTPIK